MTLDRRTFLGALAAATATPAVAATAPDNLGVVGSEHGLLFGSAFDREIFTDPAYSALIAGNCRAGAIENSFKLDWLRRGGPDANFAMTDRLVDFSATAGIALRGTGLVWNDWAPPWLAGQSTAQVKAMLDRHVGETIARYAGRMHSWDVVNEPFYPPHHRDGGFRKGPWFDAMGSAYIARAFRVAAKADPKAKLVLNEAFCEQDDALGRAVRPRLLALVTELKDAGVKLDAVGFQAHLKPHLPFDDHAFAAYLARVAALGVDIYITEFDVDDSSFPDDVAMRDAKVADRCEKFLSAVLAVPRVKSLTCWHLSDRYSWYKNTDWYPKEVQTFGGDPTRPVRSHLADTNLNPKAAWAAVARAMAARRRK
jgi:endo-1,4-beta-xylanase